MKHGKNVQIFITTRTYDAWSRYLTAKELTMFSYPANSEELFLFDNSREGLTRLLINMPNWWVEWYRNLSRDEKFRFARVLEKRLVEAKLI